MKKLQPESTAQPKSDAKPEPTVKQASADNNEPSKWAQKSVDFAIKLGIYTPESWGDSSYKAPLNRAEAVDIITSIYLLFAEGNDNINNPFNDLVGLSTDRIDKISQAFAAGITKGTSATTFNPYGSFSREQAAILAVRVYELVTNTILKPAKLSFDDNNDISNWAVNDVAKAVASGLMSGMDSEFRPKENLTMEQGLVLAFNLYNQFSAFFSEGTII